MPETGITIDREQHDGLYELAPTRGALIVGVGPVRLSAARGLQPVTSAGPLRRAHGRRGIDIVLALKSI